MTIAPQPWPEIVRVSRAHRCESLLLGLSDVNSAHLEELISSVACDVVVLHTPPGWQLKNVHRVLVPTRSLGAHDKFRARLLGSLCRTGNREVTFLQVLPEHATDFQCDRAQRRLMQFANEEVPTNASALVDAPQQTPRRNYAPGKQFRPRGFGIGAPGRKSADNLVNSHRFSHKISIAPQL